MLCQVLVHLIRKQECQIGEIHSLVDPPTGLKAQQDLYDIAEANVCSRCGPHDLSFTQPAALTPGPSARALIDGSDLPQFPGPCCG
jgi:hypothetical protein